MFLHGMCFSEAVLRFSEAVLLLCCLTMYLEKHVAVKHEQCRYFQPAIVHINSSSLQ